MSGVLVNSEDFYATCDYSQSGRRAITVRPALAVRLSLNESFTTKEGCVPPDQVDCPEPGISEAAAAQDFRAYSDTRYNSENAVRVCEAKSIRYKTDTYVKIGRDFCGGTVPCSSLRPINPDGCSGGYLGPQTKEIIVQLSDRSSPWAVELAQIDWPIVSVPTTNYATIDVGYNLNWNNNPRGMRVAYDRVNSVLVVTIQDRSIIKVDPDGCNPAVWARTNSFRQNITVEQLPDGTIYAMAWASGFSPSTNTAILRLSEAQITTAGVGAFPYNDTDGDVDSFGRGGLAQGHVVGVVDAETLLGYTDPFSIVMKVSPFNTPYVSIAGPVRNRTVWINDTDDMYFYTTLSSGVVIRQLSTGNLLNTIGSGNTGCVFYENANDWVYYSRVDDTDVDDDEIRRMHVDGSADELVWTAPSDRRINGFTLMDP